MQQSAHMLNSPKRRLNCKRVCQFQRHKLYILLSLWEYQIINIHVHLHKSITMCPRYHHNGFMATPELGHRVLVYVHLHLTRLVFI